MPDVRLRQATYARRCDCPMPLQNISSFPERGGANGSVRFKPECDHAANAGGPQLWLRLGISLICQSPCISNFTRCVLLCRSDKLSAHDERDQTASSTSVIR